MCDAVSYTLLSLVCSFLLGVAMPAQPRPCDPSVCGSIPYTNQALSILNAPLFVMGSRWMLNCCSHDKSEAGAPNDGQGVQEKTSGGYSIITKAAKKRAGKRRGQARSTEPHVLPAAHLHSGVAYCSDMHSLKAQDYWQLPNTLLFCVSFASSYCCYGHDCHTM